MSEDKNIYMAQLLFQSGAWISAMDESGGIEASNVELSAIYNTLREFQRERDYEVLRPIFVEVLSSRERWDEWTASLPDFNNQLREAATEMPLELRQCLYDLAYSVAIRYRERSIISLFFVGLKVSLRNFFFPDTRNTELSHYLKISAAEKSALNELAEILRMPQRIID